jgi:hypothetical protein
LHFQSCGIENLTLNLNVAIIPRLGRPNDPGISGHKRPIKAADARITRSVILANHKQLLDHIMAPAIQNGLQRGPPLAIPLLGNLLKPLKDLMIYEKRLPCRVDKRNLPSGTAGGQDK